MISWISSLVANLNQSNGGGAAGGQEWGEGIDGRAGEKEEQSLAILSEKTLRKEEARNELEKK